MVIIKAFLVRGGACHLEVAPRSITAINVCQKDFPTVLTCADSHQQPENENVCASLEWLRPMNLTVVQSYLNTAVRIKKAEMTFFFLMFFQQFSVKSYLGV